MKTVTVSEKGWIVIPKEIRERLGIGPGDQVAVFELGGEIHVIKKQGGDPIERTYGMFKGGPSSTAALLEDRRWELEREERDLPAPRSREDEA